MDKPLVEQEREISDLVRRAQKNPDRTGNQRKDTFRRLIELTHSPHSSLKSYAASHLRFFFKDFPELEEAAINAVYDLCEDPSSKIRIDGYTAIVQISREQKKWVKRNADVLVQLLQSDEPDEVVVVKKALCEHLDMDPRVTLAVLCDQMTPLDNSCDEEDKEIRDRLRFLVLSFLAGEAKRAIVERHANQAGSETEAVLIDGLLMAIPISSNAEVEMIVNDLLLSLPSFKLPSARTDSLVDILVDRAEASFRDESSPENTVSIPMTRFFLDLVSHLFAEKQIPFSSRPLRFCCTAFMSRPLLHKLHRDDQIWVIIRTTGFLHESDGLRGKQDSSNFRRRVVNASTVLLEILGVSESSDLPTWQALSELLKVCVQQISAAAWSPSANLVESLRTIQDLAARHHNGQMSGLISDIQEKIRLLLPTTGDKGSRAPSGTASAPRLRIIPAQASSTRDDGKAPSQVPSGTSRNKFSKASTPPVGPNKRSTVDDDSLRSIKRAKINGEGGPPSLLSRMSFGQSKADNREIELSTKPRTTKDGYDLDTDVDSGPTGGFSIKGAAKMEEEKQRRNASSISNSSSLLERLGGNDLDSGVGADGNWEYGSGRKNRGKS